MNFDIDVVVTPHLVVVMTKVMIARIKTLNSRIFINLRLFKPEHNETVNSVVYFLTDIVTNDKFPLCLWQLKMPTPIITWLPNINNNIAVKIPQGIFKSSKKNRFVPIRCITFTSISFASTFCMMPGYGSPSSFTTHHWPTWDSSAAFSSRRASGILHLFYVRVQIPLRSKNRVQGNRNN